MDVRLKDSVKAIGNWLQADKSAPHPAARIASAVPYVLIVGLALGLRIHLASFAYPAQSDSTHMIQQGILWVQGEPGALSTIWQEFPVLTSGIAYRLGWNPAEALQWSTVIFGTLLVGMTMLLTRRLFDSDAAAWIAGGWAAANQGLLNHSVNSMPEIGFAACLVSAYAVLAPAIRGQGLKFVPLLAGYGLLGLGMYFKPLDSLTAVALATGWLFLMHLRQVRRIALPLLAGLLCYIAIVSPHYMLQNRGTGANDIQLANRAFGLVKGLRAYDSKFENAPDGVGFGQDLKEFEQLGAVKWLWLHRVEISRNYVSNVMRSLRVYSNYLFPKAFRMGNAWFIAMLASILTIRLCSPEWKPFAFLALATMTFPLGVSLSYVYDRWLIIYLPLLIIAISGHLVSSSALWDRRWKQAIWLLLVVAMMGSSAMLTCQDHRDRIWQWANERSIAIWLRNTTSYGERIMAGKPSLALEMDLDSPHRWVRLPNAAVDQIEQISAEKNVSYVVLCDSFYPHWPVNQLLQGAPAPQNWTLVKKVKFERLHPIWGEQKEIYQIYKRSETGAETSQ